MMDDVNHIMQTIATSDEGWTVECPDCGKVRVVYWEQGRPPATLTRGDDEALHSWSSTPGLVMGTPQVAQSKR